jgi:hypothetical protein
MITQRHASAKTFGVFCETERACCEDAMKPQEIDEVIANKRKRATLISC